MRIIPCFVLCITRVMTKKVKISLTSKRSFVPNQNDFMYFISKDFMVQIDNNAENQVNYSTGVVHSCQKTSIQSVSYISS